MTPVDDPQAPPVAPAERLTEHLDPRVVPLWQVNAALGWLVWTGVAVAALLVLGRSPWWSLIAAIPAVVHILQVPPRRYRHFTFRVDESDVRVAHGWLWRTGERRAALAHPARGHAPGPRGADDGARHRRRLYGGERGGDGGHPRAAQAARAEALRDALVRLSGTDDAV